MICLYEVDLYKAAEQVFGHVNLFVGERTKEQCVEAIVQEFIKYAILDPCDDNQKVHTTQGRIWAALNDNGGLRILLENSKGKQIGFIDMTRDEGWQWVNRIQSLIATP